MSKVDIIKLNRGMLLGNNDEKPVYPVTTGAAVFVKEDGKDKRLDPTLGAKCGWFASVIKDDRYHLLGFSTKSTYLDYLSTKNEDLVLMDAELGKYEEEEQPEPNIPMLISPTNGNIVLENNGFVIKGTNLVSDIKIESLDGNFEFKPNGRTGYCQNVTYKVRSEVFANITSALGQAFTLRSTTTTPDSVLRGYIRITSSDFDPVVFQVWSFQSAVLVHPNEEDSIDNSISIDDLTQQAQTIFVQAYNLSNALIIEALTPSGDDAENIYVSKGTDVAYFNQTHSVTIMPGEAAVGVFITVTAAKYNGSVNQSFPSYNFNAVLHIVSTSDAVEKAIPIRFYNGNGSNPQLNLLVNDASIEALTALNNTSIAAIKISQAIDGYTGTEVTITTSNLTQPLKIWLVSAYIDMWYRTSLEGEWKAATKGVLPTVKEINNIPAAVANNGIYIKLLVSSDLPEGINIGTAVSNTILRIASIADTSGYQEIPQTEYSLQFINPVSYGGDLVHQLVFYKNTNPALYETMSKLAKENGATMTQLGMTQEQCNTITELPVRAMNGVTKDSKREADFTSLQELSFFSNLQTIRMCAFMDCTLLERVIIPESVLTIEDSAFAFCTNLTTVTFEEGANITKLGNSVFIGCEVLDNVKLPGTIKSFGEELFAYCPALQNLEVEEGITVLPKKAFWIEGVEESTAPINSLVLPSTIQKIPYLKTLFRHMGEEEYSTITCLSPTPPEVTDFTSDYRPEWVFSNTEVRVPEDYVAAYTGATDTIWSRCNVVAIEEE